MWQVYGGKVKSLTSGDLTDGRKAARQEIRSKACREKSADAIVRNSGTRKGRAELKEVKEDEGYWKR